MSTLSKAQKAEIAEIMAATLRALGVAPAEVRAESPVAEARAPESTPSWLVARGARKAARRALAAQMRAQGLDPSDAKAWAKAKKAAGITADERAAHAAYEAEKAARA